jgi:hypothetical protein
MPETSHFVFSLGLIPVQEWIGEARRSRDLLAGSVFLSYVMARVLGGLEPAPGDEIVLPLPPAGRSFSDLAQQSFAESLAQPYGIPNRASGFLASTTPDHVRTVLGRLQGEVVATTWEDLKKEHLADFLNERGLGRAAWAGLREAFGEYLRATAGGGDCPVQLVWCALPWDGAPEHRPEALDHIDWAYDDVKRTRAVRPWTHGSEAAKCNQCGRREAIGPTQDFQTWRRWQDQLATLRTVETGWRIDPGERHCYVCLAKRLAGYAVRTRFPSTGDVATGPWLDRVEASGRGGLVQELRETDLGKEDLGRTLLSSEEKLRQLGATDALEARRRLEHAIDRHNHTLAPGAPPIPARPRPYVAILTFDGDDMGRKVREHLEAVPRGMNEFATTARELIDERTDRHAGIFYLGGDEGLVMAPAGSALELALALHERFTRCFQDLADPPTLSMGLAFFEYSRPLSGAIETARTALRTAKERQGKSSLGVSVETSSGSVWHVVRPWGGTAWQRLAAAVDLIRRGRLASGWPHDAERFLLTLEPGAWGRPGVPEAALAELRRLFARRVAAPAGPARRAAVEAAWAEIQGDAWLADGKERIEPDELHLLAFLARQALDRAPETEAVVETETARG